MENKTAITVILSIVAVMGGIVMNFEKFAWGGPANIQNLIVSFSYLAIWVFVLIRSTEARSSKLVKYCFSFWVLTFFFSLLTTYINLTKASADWAIPFVIIFLGPLDGLRFFVNDFMISSVIIAVISFGLSAATIFLFKHRSRKTE